MGLFDKITEKFTDAASDKIHGMTVGRLQAGAERRFDSMIDSRIQATSDQMVANGMAAGMAEMGMTSMPDMAQMQAAQSQIMEYGQEQQRIQSVGVRGTAVMMSMTPIQGAPQMDPGLQWMSVQAEITVHGREPYVATVTQMVAAITAHLYAPGTSHAVAVDPANTNLFAYV